MDPKQTSPQGGQEGQNAGPGKLSTGANFSRTMDNLNAEQGATYGGMSFSKHNFDKIEPGTGDIILGGTPEKKRGLFGSGRKQSAPSGWDMNAAQAAEAAKTGAAPTEQAFTTNRSSVAFVPSEFQNPTPEKKPLVNKKLLIVLVIIVILAGLGAVIGLVVVPNLARGNKSSSSGNTNNSSSISTITIDEYTGLANYIVFGNENTESNEVDGTKFNLLNILNNTNNAADANSIFYANRELAKDDSAERTSYFERMSELFDDLNLSDGGLYNDEVKAMRAFYVNLYTNKELDKESDSYYELCAKALRAIKRLYEEFYGTNEDNTSESSTGELE